MTRDYYEILGVDRNASPKEIKRAYRNIIKLCHPDSPHFRMDPDKIYQVQNAYETLGDQKKRAKYDRELAAQKINVGPGRFKGSSGPLRHSNSDVEIFDIFEDPTFSPDPQFSDKMDILDILSGRMRSWYRSDFFGDKERRGLDIILTPQEAVRGGAYTISIPGQRSERVGSFTLRIPPGVRSGTRLLLDLDDVIGISCELKITILVEAP